MLRSLAILAAVGAVAPACGKPLQTDDPPAASTHKSAAGKPEKRVTDQTSVSRRFGTLDDYLAYLKQRGALDMAWWREVEPGVYERVSTFRPADGRVPERATRAELMRRFGFER